MSRGQILRGTLYTTTPLAGCVISSVLNNWYCSTKLLMPSGLLRCPLFIYSPYLGESAFRGSTKYYTWVRDVIIFFFLDFTMNLPEEGPWIFFSN